MDALTGLLDGPRARGAFLLRMIMEPPWSVRVQDRAPLALVAITRGDAWVVPDEGQAVRLRPGDVAVMRGPDPYLPVAVREGNEFLAAISADPDHHQQAQLVLLQPDVHMDSVGLHVDVVHAGQVPFCEGALPGLPGLGEPGDHQRGQPG